jgi:hypothetical protein
MASGPRPWRCRQVEIAGLGEVFSVCQTREVQAGRVGVVRFVGSRNCFGSKTSPSTAGTWKISWYIMTSAWTSLETTWKNRGLMPRDICVLFLSPLTSIHVKQYGILLSGFASCNVNVHFLTNITEKSRVISGKLTVAHLVKKRQTTSRIRSFNAVFTRARHQFLTWDNSNQSKSYHTIALKTIIIVQFHTHTFFEWSLPFRLSNQYSVPCSHTYLYVTRPVHLILPNIITFKLPVN